MGAGDQRPVETPSSELWVVAGLGNPGQAYAKTRHNIGFRVIDHLVENRSFIWERSAVDLVCARGQIGATEVLLAKPLAYMNRSGPPLRSLTQEFRIHCKQMLVVYDDIDLAYGTVKIKE